MTESSMYWLTRLDQIGSFFTGIQTFAVVFGVLGLVVVGLMLIIKNVNAQYNRPGEGYVDNDYRVADTVIKTLRLPLIACAAVGLACSIATTFIPTTKEMAAIKVIPMLASPGNCEKIRGISKDLVDVAAGWLEDEKKKQK